MKKVLLIEDDAPLCLLLEKILKNSCEIFIINDGMEAWSWLTDGNTPDLIISDLKLPNLDGIELLENLSNSGLFTNIPVIILSGYEDGNKRRRCLELGAFTYLLKPFDPQSLVTEVDRALAFRKENLLVN